MREGWSRQYTLRPEQLLVIKSELYPIGMPPSLRGCGRHPTLKFEHLTVFSLRVSIETKPREKREAVVGTVWYVLSMGGSQVSVGVSMDRWV